MYFNLFLIHHATLEFIGAIVNRVLGVLKKVLSRIRIGRVELKVEEITPIQLNFDSRVQVYILKTFVCESFNS
jgi:hypothetical protein